MDELWGGLLGTSGLKNFATPFCVMTCFLLYAAVGCLGGSGFLGVLGVNKEVKYSDADLQLPYSLEGVHASSPDMLLKYTRKEFLHIILLDLDFSKHQSWILDFGQKVWILELKDPPPLTGTFDQQEEVM